MSVGCIAAIVRAGVVGGDMGVRCGMIRPAIERGSVVSHRTIAMMLVAASTTGLVACAVVAWLNLRYRGTITAALVTMVVMTATTAECLMLRRRWGRILAGCVGALLLVGVAVLVWWAPMFERQVAQVVLRTRAPDGSALLVVRLGHGFLQIDPSYDAVLQTDRGALSQETLVWEGLEEGDAPQVVRFVGPHDIEIVSAAGCTYRSTFDPTTLRPEHVYCQRALGRCG
jgi:hypothetical protein